MRTNSQLPQPVGPARQGGAGREPCPGEGKLRPESAHYRQTPGFWGPACPIRGEGGAASAPGDGFQNSRDSDHPRGCPARGGGGEAEPWDPQVTTPGGSGLTPPSASGSDKAKGGASVPNPQESGSHGD